MVSAPGGNTDALARSFGQRLSERVGKSMVIDNKAGGGGVIAGETVARAIPDGYTLLLANLSHSVMSVLHEKLSFDPVQDFVPVAMLGLTGSVLVANPSVPAKTVQDIIALAKARPNSLNYAGGTTGATAHLSGELFKLMTGLKIVHVPYKGTGAGITAILGGEVQIAFLTIPPCVPLIQSGKLRGIAIGSIKHSAALPDLPTVSESGVPGFDVSAWNSILAPRGTPRSIVVMLNREINQIADNAEIKSRSLAQGTELENQTPEQFAVFLAAQSAKWTKVVKAADMKAH